MKTQHTPGPWNINHGANYLPSISSGTTHTKIADIAPQDNDAGIKDFQNESEANARLIAAAPELFEALIKLDFAALYLADSIHPGKPEVIEDAQKEVHNAHMKAKDALQKVIGETFEIQISPVMREAIKGAI